VIALITFGNGTVVSIATGHLSGQGYRVGIDYILDGLTISQSTGEARIKHPKGEEIIRNTNDAYADEDRAFIDCVKTDNPGGVFCSYADAFETHRVCMAANESLESGKVVTLE